MSKGSLIIYSGPSGVGKGTIIAPFIETGRFALSVSATTRAPREGEQDGVNYHFMSKEAFERRIMQGELLEYAKYADNYYGTPKEFVERELEKGRDVLLEIEVVGAMKVKESFPEATLIFVMPPSFEELHRRLVGRGTESEEEIAKRLAAAKKEIGMAYHYDFIIVNDDLEAVRGQLIKAVEAGKLLSRKNIKFIKEVEELC